MTISQPAVRSTKLADPPLDRSSTPPETANVSGASIPAEIERAYLAIADDPRYQHFVRIPDRIIQCVDYLGIGCDRVAARTRLRAYYLFIGVVDESIDSRQIDTGRLILDYLNTRVPLFDETVRRSRVRLVTEILKCQADDESHPLLLNMLRQLYEAVVRERSARSIESYIEQRKSVGALTAEISYLLIRPALIAGPPDRHEKICGLMKQAGAIGCLVDSLIDLSADRRLGLLGFKPRMSDYAKLIVSTGRDGLRVLLRHPRLATLFLRAIGDTIGDRLRAGPNLAKPAFASDRKAEPASVV
jgi:hypothetical protein